MKNNEAFFAKLENITPIDGADNIVQADVVVNNSTITKVVTGKDTKPGTMVVYFDSNMCLKPAILEKYPELGNYLSKNGRVKVVKLRGCISNGLAVEFDKFKVFDKWFSFIEGNSFLEINKIEICAKYEPPIEGGEMCNSNNGRPKAKSRMITGQFNFHNETSQLFRNIKAVQPDDIISISRKFHGTSWIVSNCLVKKKLTKIEKVAKFFGANIVESEYDTIAASRRLIKNGTFETPLHISYNIWESIKDKYFKDVLQPGETVYGEVVGFLESGKHIQKNYNYGCSERQCKVLIYRITKTDSAGNVIELDWKQVKERCIELGIQMVTEYYYGKASDLFKIAKDENWNINFAKSIRETYLEKIANDCGEKIPDEGVVIRIDGLKIKALKAKSESFLLFESKANEKEVNIDEAN
jgi:hypothetical protein